MPGIHPSTIPTLPSPKPKTKPYHPIKQVLYKQNHIAVVYQQHAPKHGGSASCEMLASTLLPTEGTTAVSQAHWHAKSDRI
jgi:hypothetical protein